MSRTELTLMLVAVLVPSVVFHEIAHGLAALRLGDDTARKAGRLSMNPIRHIDPFGTVVLPLVMALSLGFAIGYAKPVPVMIGRLGHPRRDALLVSLAGPAMNGLIGFAAIGLFRVFRPENGSFVWFVFAITAVVNIALALFNLLPIPPLDGSAIIEFALPDRFRVYWYRFRPYSVVGLIIVLLVFRSALDPIFEWAVGLWRAQQ